MTRHDAPPAQLCVMCHHPLPPRRWWHLLESPPLCPKRAINACQARFDIRVRALTLGLPDPPPEPPAAPDPLEQGP